jgi:hypothetical protein
MVSGRIGCELAVVAVAVLCVLVIFFSPSIQGPYSVVHGPATALQTARESARLLAAIVQGAFTPQANGLISPLVVLSWISLSGAADFHSFTLPECYTVLNC